MTGRVIAHRTASKLPIAIARITHQRSYIDIPHSACSVEACAARQKRLYPVHAHRHLATHVRPVPGVAATRIKPHLRSWSSVALIKFNASVDNSKARVALR
jgi:hypothetical protein